MRDGNRGHHLSYLEWMITTSCDLACPGCDRFIDYDHRWTEDLSNITKNMQFWSQHLDPDNFTIIGGEPLIHPHIYKIIKESRKHFDHARIEVFSNGLLIPKKPKLIDALIKYQPSKLHVTLHNKDEYVRGVIQKNIQNYIFKDLPWRQIDENFWQYGDVQLEISDPTQGGWYDYRQIVDGQLKPWADGDPQSSYDHCSANIYPIIYDNRLYKCPPISMLKTHAQKYGLINDEDWAPYLEYTGLGQDCTEHELEEFINNIHCHHKICAMCPANPVLKPQDEAVIKGIKHIS